MIYLYSIIILLATIAGSIAGLGGGVIIKPMLDMIGYHDVNTISLYSSVAVFSMCMVSIYKQLKNGFTFDIKVISIICLGSVIGGLVGESIFTVLIKVLDNEYVKVLQAILLLITLIGIVGYTKYKGSVKKAEIKNLYLTFCIGLLLGTISIFLGIGGGPLNVTVLLVFFSYSLKEATVYSIATIFFSQISKLSSIILLGKITQYDLSFIPFIIFAAIIGGYIGTIINQRLKEVTVQKVYILLLYMLIVISIYNVCVNIG